MGGSGNFRVDHCKKRFLGRFRKIGVDVIMLQKNGLRSLNLLIACVGVTLLSWDTCSAQQPSNTFGAGRRNRPTVSPYVSLTDNGNGNNGSDMNYFNIVRPTQRAREANRNLQNQLQSVESDLSKRKSVSGTASSTNKESRYAINTGRMPSTGHTTSFGDLGGRFGSASGNSQFSGSNTFGRDGNN